jgi:N-methylhydantoinase A/oxoprolinase/acetone carboxylase beta subunit
MTLAIEGVASLPGAARQWKPAREALLDGARRGERRVYLGGDQGATQVPVFAAEGLVVGDQLEGPAIVEAEDTTVLLGADHRLRIDELLNMRIDYQREAK